jgi:hypothetical protein
MFIHTCSKQVFLFDSMDKFSLSVSVSVSVRQVTTCFDNSDGVQAGRSEQQVSVDVCFVMDCTGSMGSWIDACKRKVLSVSLQSLLHLEKGVLCL